VPQAWYAHSACIRGARHPQVPKRSPLIVARATGLACLVSGQAPCRWRTLCSRRITIRVLSCVSRPKSQRSLTSTRSILGTSFVPHWAQCSVRQGYERWHLIQYATRTFFQRTMRGSLFRGEDFVFIHMDLLDLGGLLGAKVGVLGPVVHGRCGQLAVLLQLGDVDLVRSII